MSHLIETVYNLLWGDLFTLPVGGGIGISLMAVLLLTAGVFFTLRTRLLPVRLFRDMIAAVCEKNQSMDSLSSFQTLIVSTATRVGMGNLVGVVAAVSAGGAGAVFWMWVTALLGASTSFVESTLAQKYRQPDPLYGGQRGGPAYYIHVLAERKQGKKLRHSIIAVLFAISGLICWCGISQVISNSVSSAFANAFSIPPIVTTVVLVVLSAVIVLRKDATVKSLDVIVPIMAVCYFVMTVIIIAVNFRQLPAVLGRIFSEAFGLRQVAAGGFGAVIFPLDMFINSDYMLNLGREEFAKELERLFDEDKIGYAQVVVATDIHDMHRIALLTDPTQKDKLNRIAVSLFGVPKREARRIIAKYQAQ